jgi:glycosyltransferase involved in cell wall biosynthesis
MQTPAVSIIIIFFNAERFLAEAIDSVLRQTETDWELLLVDDGSTDGSTAIAREFARAMEPGHTHARIRYLEHPRHQNRGMSATRNLGIRHSRGEWVAFLDSDDVWNPDKLTEQRRLLALNPNAGMLYGSPLYWFSWSKELSRFKDCQPGVSVAPESLVAPPGLMLRNYPLGEGPAPCPSDLIVSRSVLQRVGGFEETFGGAYQMYEDQAFLAKAYLTTPVFVSGRCWTRYRQHPDACSTVVRDSGQYLDVRRFFLEYLERYLSAQKIDDKQIRQAMERAWWPWRHPHLASVRQLYARSRRRLRRYLQGSPVAVNA